MNFFTIIGLFSVSLILGLAVIAAARHYNLGADLTVGVQRAHSHWVPRLGGVQIFVTLTLWILLGLHELEEEHGAAAGLWVLCLLPAFAVGLLEDLTQRVGAWARLLTTMFGAGVAFYLINVQVARLGIPLLDGWLASWPLLSLAVTMLFVGGGAHALNIIDGYNGLASSFAIVVLFAILVVAGRVHDFELMYLSVGTLCATAGFFVLNFPHGRIFLGDGGAYTLGTVIGFLLAILVARHPVVSPMFAAVLLVYPVWELLFSSYRRRILRGTPAMRPDASHLHTLVHKRLVRSHLAENMPGRKILMNSATTLYMLVPGICVTCLALAFWSNTLALVAVFFSFITAYLLVYFSLVRFRAQRLSIKPVWERSGRQKGRSAAPRRASTMSPVAARGVSQD